MALHGVRRPAFSTTRPSSDDLGFAGGGIGAVLGSPQGIPQNTAFAQRFAETQARDSASQAFMNSPLSGQQFTQQMGQQNSPFAGRGSFLGMRGQMGGGIGQQRIGQALGRFGAGGFGQQQPGGIGQILGGGGEVFDTRGAWVPGGGLGQQPNPIGLGGPSGGVAMLGGQGGQGGGLLQQLRDRFGQGNAFGGRFGRIVRQ